VAFTLGGDKNRDSLLEGCHRYDPDGAPHLGRS
jgi:hypothetical protein